MPGFSDLLERNQTFAASGTYRGLGGRPNFMVVVVACLDPRVEPAEILAIGLGDAMVLRNVSGRITSGVLDDLAYVSMSMEAAIPEGPIFEVAIVHHTQCGAMALKNDAMRERYAERIGVDEVSLRDYADDPEKTVATDVARVLAAPEFFRSRARVRARLRHGNRLDSNDQGRHIAGRTRQLIRLRFLYRPSVSYGGTESRSMEPNGLP